MASPNCVNFLIMFSKNLLYMFYKSKKIKKQSNPTLKKKITRCTVFTGCAFNVEPKMGWVVLGCVGLGEVIIRRAQVWCGNNIWYEGQFYRTVGTLRSYHLILLVRLHHLASIIITKTGFNIIIIFITTNSSTILIMISFTSFVPLKEEVDR